MRLIEQFVGHIFPLLEKSAHLVTLAAAAAKTGIRISQCRVPGAHETVLTPLLTLRRDGSAILRKRMVLTVQRVGIICEMDDGIGRLQLFLMRERGRGRLEVRQTAGR